MISVLSVIDPWQWFFGILLFLTGVFLMLLVLVQRGRGGGLAGAFGGLGGQSAFGAKAGDTFTKITIYAATFWILLCVAAILVLNPPPAKPKPGPETIQPPARKSDEGATGDKTIDDTTRGDKTGTDAPKKTGSRKATPSGNPGGC